MYTHLLLTDHAQMLVIRKRPYDPNTNYILSNFLTSISQAAHLISTNWNSINWSVVQENVFGSPLADPYSLSRVIQVFARTCRLQLSCKKMCTNIFALQAYLEVYDLKLLYGTPECTLPIFGLFLPRRADVTKALGFLLYTTLSKVIQKWTRTVKSNDKAFLKSGHMGAILVEHDRGT